MDRQGNEAAKVAGGLHVRTLATITVALIVATRAAGVARAVDSRARSTPVSLSPFYESDCQGRFSPSLIAFSFSPWQSAPSDPWATIVSASGWAEQSSSADSYSASSFDPVVYFTASARSLHE